MANGQINPCNRLAPVRSLATQDVAAEARTGKAVRGAFLLTSIPAAHVPAVLRGGLVVAPPGHPPARVRFAVPHPFALACGSLALRPAVTLVRSCTRRCSFALRRDELTETWFQQPTTGEPA